MYIDYYKKLEISPKANSTEVKAAFRKKIKALHPDVNANNPEINIELSRVIAAYETLIDSERRKEYDERFSSRIYQENRFNYRNFLIKRLHVAQFWGRLLLFEFLHSRNANALQLFETYKGLHSLSEALDRSDYLDCLVFLGEEYLVHKRYEDAFCCFEKIIIEENKHPYFKHFVVEVYNYIYSMVDKIFPRILAKEKLVMYTNRTRALQVPKKSTLAYTAVNAVKGVYYEDKTV